MNQIKLEIVGRIHQSKAAACTAVLLGLNLLFSGAGAWAGEVRIIAGPYLQNVKKDGITIMWETDVAAPSRVDYGATKKCEVSRSSEDLVTIHEVTLSGLTVETGYYYRVSSAGAQSEICAFRTAIKKDTPFTFVVYGDSQGNSRGTPQRASKRHQRIADEAASWKPDLLLHVGDIVGWGPNGRKEFRDHHFGPGRELLKNVPSYLALGNREVNAPAWYDYASTPEPEHENYYSFDYGNVHFVILDSLPFAHIHQSGFWPKPGYPGSRSALKGAEAQMKWLEKDLKSADAKWTFVFFHHPVYISADEGGTQESLKQRVVPILEKFDVDIVFTGHWHFYERTHPMKDGKIDQEEGILYVTTGGAGGGLERPSPAKGRDFTAKLHRRYHYCRVEIDGGRFDMKVYHIKGWEPGEQIQSEKILDTVTLRK